MHGARRKAECKGLPIFSVPAAMSVRFHGDSWKGMEDGPMGDHVGVVLDNSDSTKMPIKIQEEEVGRCLPGKSYSSLYGEEIYHEDNIIKSSLEGRNRENFNPRMENGMEMESDDDLDPDGLFRDDEIDETNIENSGVANDGGEEEEGGANEEGMSHTSGGQIRSYLSSQLWWDYEIEIENDEEYLRLITLVKERNMVPVRVMLGNDLDRIFEEYETSIVEKKLAKQKQEKTFYLNEGLKPDMMDGLFLNYLNNNKILTWSNVENEQKRYEDTVLKEVMMKYPGYKIVLDETHATMEEEMCPEDFGYETNWNMFMGLWEETMMDQMNQIEMANMDQDITGRYGWQCPMCHCVLVMMGSCTKCSKIWQMKSIRHKLGWMTSYDEDERIRRNLERIIGYWIPMDHIDLIILGIMAY